MDNNLIQMRDRAMQCLKVGIEKFNSCTGHSEKRAGYDLTVQGIKLLNAYYTQETNPIIKQQLRPKIGEYLDMAEKMKRDADAALQSQQQQQQQLANSNPNLNMPQQQQQQQQPRQQQQAPTPPPKEDDTGFSKVKDDDDEKLYGALQGAIVTDKPNVSWDDVAGLEVAKKTLQEAVILPIKFPQIFQGAIQPWKGILLYGPPGTGKTFLAKACATECDATFFSVSSSDLISKYVGESEKLIKTLFKMAREKKPSIIFIDEVDSMASSRGDGENESTKRVKTEFLVQMQGVGNDEKGLLVLGATNIPWGLDSAIRRRFEKRIYIPLPDQAGRLSLLKNQLSKTPNKITDQEMQEIAEVSEGYSGADLNTLIREAAYQPLRKCEKAVKFKPITRNGQQGLTPCAPSDPAGQTMKFLEIEGDQLMLPEMDYDDFMVALTKVKPSVGETDFARHDQFTTEFGQEG